MADAEKARAGKRHTFGSVARQVYDGVSDAFGELGEKLPDAADKIVDGTGEAMEELGRKVPDAVGKVITEGGKATGKSFEELADAYRNNEQFRTALHVALAAGMTPKLAVSAALYGPEMIATVMQHPKKLATGIEAITDVVSPMTPSTPGGYAKRALEER